MPAMYMTPSSYPYDMVVYASVDIHGTQLTVENSGAYVIAAYVGEEVRLRCYYRGHARAELFPDMIVFDGEMHGELTNLYPLVLGDDAEEYVPDTIVSNIYD